MSRHPCSFERMFPVAGFRFVDLFAGIGGFHRALSQLGGTCVRAVEIDPDCRTVYASAFPHTEITEDVRLLTCGADGRELSLGEVAATVPDHEVLCAGFPCQPFSKSGAQLGVRDRTRGTLFFDVMTVVLAKRPEFVLLENVRNLAGPRHTDTWNTIIDSLHAAGYFVPRKPLVVSPHDLPPWWGGAPQARDRVFILARRDPEGGGGDVPLFDLSGLTTGWGPDRWSIEDVLDDDDAIDDVDAYGLRYDELTWLEAWQAFVQGVDADVLPGFPIWVDAFREVPRIPAGTPAWKADFLRKNSDLYRAHRHFIDAWLKVEWGPLRQRVADFPASRRKFEWQARKAQPRHKDRNLWKLVIQLRPSGIRVKPATYLPALVAITQTSVIGSRRRRITPPEAAVLQGMPRDLFVRAGVSDKAAYKQLGNAVNVGVVRAMATILFAAGNAAWMADVDIAVKA